jgi:predicted nucleic acid-binding protein
VTGTLVDAGPLVALLDRSDRHHAACVTAAKTLPAPLLSVWPVVTEAMYLLGDSWIAQRALLAEVIDGTLKLLPLGPDDVRRIRQLMEKYRDLPMDLADASLVAVGERERVVRVFTLDRRDFSLYRPARLGRFDIVP